MENNYEVEKEENLPVSYENKLPEYEEISKLINEKKFNDLKRLSEDIPAPDLGKIIEMLPKEEVIIFYRILSKDKAADTFIHMPSELQECLISAFSEKELSDTLAELYLDDTVDIIEEMPAVLVKKILRNSSSENRNIINRLLQYSPDSAGSIMTTEYMRFSPDLTVEQALERVRQTGEEKETIYVCYVTDKSRKLLGVVTARSLMLSDTNTLLEDIMQKNVIFALTSDDKETVAEKFNRYGLIAVPVVDNELRLVGIITVDDAMEVMKDETEEDFAKMAAIIPSETDYLKTSPFSVFKSRIPWLLLLMISATFTGAILNRFESVLIPTLVLFVPMLMDTAGNSGSQASVTVIRTLSYSKLRASDVIGIILKELSVGALCGAALGTVGFLKILLVDRLLLNNPSVTVWVALSVAITIIATVMVAKLIGALLPILAKQMGFDPAVMASPFITTIVDTVGLIVYFVISAYLFGLTV